MKELASDATILDTIDTLKNPLDNVCGVLANLYKCRAQYGSAEVVIGVTGAGKRPYY